MFSWITWATLLGGGGIAIAAAATFFIAPSLFAIALDRFLKIGAAIVSTRIGVGMLALLAGFVVADIHRSRVDQADWNRRVAEFKAKQDARDAMIKELTKKAADAQIDADAKAKQEIDDAIAKFKEGLSPNPACLVGDDADRLRSLVGGKPFRQNKRRVLPSAKRGAVP